MSTTWESANSGLSTSSRYTLDPNDKSNILVYKYRSGLPGCEITTQGKLRDELDKASLNSSTLSFASKATSSTAKSDPTGYVAPRFRVSRKAIPRTHSRVDLRMEDLWTEQERELYSKYPSSKNSLASVGLPTGVYMKRLVFGSYPDLYIVSPVSSPESSLNNSPEQSQQVSPQSTFPKESRKTSEER